jgi:hypothetical protein
LKSETIKRKLRALSSVEAPGAHLMSVSFYQSCIPVYERSLTALSAIIDKAEAHAIATKFDPAIYVTTRLRPDMFTFARQVQTACDNAKNAAARVAGAPPTPFEDNETTLDELKTRIQRTLDVLAKIDRAAFEAGAAREVVFPARGGKAKMLGADYLAHHALPNFYFHLVTAYNILRDAGVPIGKRDYLGATPGVTMI